MLARDYDEFVTKALNGIKNGLNGEVGQALTQELLQNALTKNQNMTVEEWEKMKQDFMLFCFMKVLRESPELWEEFATHVWEELQKGDGTDETGKTFETL